jgi:hypothetical protein
VFDAGKAQLNILLLLHSRPLNNPSLLSDQALVQGGLTETCLCIAPFIHIPIARVGEERQRGSRKIEFSFLNGNLIVPASLLCILRRDTLPTMEERMFVESTQALLFLAIVGLTVVSTIDLVMQPIKQEKNTDREH